ncbi:hypothetical protein LTR66_001333 [Elasticomyces elasticus]|nr:hypothetical protein LTR66_001333 [Elasticomyces elasticus]
MEGARLDLLALDNTPDLGAVGNNAAHGNISESPQRRFFLHDELAAVYIVLEISSKQLRETLSRLVITVEGHVVSSDHGSHQGAPQRELVVSKVIRSADEPIAIYDVLEKNTEDQQRKQIVWKTELSLHRTSTKMQKPAIFFSASAILEPAMQPSSSIPNDDYIPSGVPAPANLLEPLQQDPAFAGRNIYLSASRVAKVMPTAPSKSDILRPLRGATRRSFPIASALIIKPTFSWIGQALLVALSVTVTSFAGSDVCLKEVKATLSEGNVDSLVPVEVLGLPRDLPPGSETRLLYRLSPGEYSPAAGSLMSASVQNLDVTVNAVVLVSERCRPQLQIAWHGKVDLLPPTLKSPQPAKPSSLQSQPPEVSSRNSTTAARPSTATDLGLLINLTSPAETAVGETFTWDVFVINRGSRVRRLALFVILPNAAAPDVSLSTMRGAAKAVLDSAVLVSMQKRAAKPRTELVDLNADVRVGPLAPGACFNTELRFLALLPGPLHVEAVRVVDLDTKEAVDVKDLPSIVAVKREDA